MSRPEGGSKEEGVLSCESRDAGGTKSRVVRVIDFVFHDHTQFHWVHGRGSKGTFEGVGGDTNVILG